MNNISNQNINILIIDDSKSLSSSIGRFLQSKNFAVAYAYDGLDGLNMAKAKFFDIILLDNEMPTRNGLDIIEEIKQHNDEIEIIFMTSTGSEEIAVKAFEKGVSSYIIKGPMHKMFPIMIKYIDESLLLQKLKRDNKDLIEKLKKHNEELEIKVKERTIDLQKANSELKTLDILKDNFITLIGHELRTPLTTIIGFADNLASGALNAEEIKTFSLFFSQEAYKLNSIVNNIINLGLLENNKITFDLQQHDLNQIIKTIVNNFKNLSNNDSSEQIVIPEIILNLGENLNQIIFDKEWISKVFSDIIMNAVYFAKENNIIQITTKHISSSSENKILVSFKDNGIGISKENANKIFKKFEQIENIMKHHKGLGISMPMAKIVIEKGHQGKIWFESEGEGQGSTFFVSFPG